MQAPPPLARPTSLPDLPPEVLAEHPEVADLAALSAAGQPVGALVVVPSALEERFYRLNNLPALLNDLFAAVDPADPDEDDVEEACPPAEALVRQHYMLDETIDDFYQATQGLPERLHVRRPYRDGRVAVRGRPALMALKQLYQSDWSYDAVWARLREGRGIALEARPVLVHGVDEAEGGARDDARATLTRRAAQTLGAPCRLRLTGDGAIVGVVRTDGSPHGSRG